jgi:nicotinamidase-related amidase
MKRVLIVVDMQNDFIDGALGTSEARKIVPLIRDKISACGRGTGVIFTRDTHGEDYLSTQEGSLLPVIHCVKNTDGHKINKELYLAYYENTQRHAVNVGVTPISIINKYTFGSIDLMRFIENLVSNGLEEIEFIGLCTDICVIANAILAKTYFPETKIFVDASCCAGTTPEKHRSAIEVMKSLQIIITNE